MYNYEMIHSIITPSKHIKQTFIIVWVMKIKYIQRKYNFVVNYMHQTFKHQYINKKNKLKLASFITLIHNGICSYGISNGS